MWNKLLLYYHTLKYLKWPQIKFRLFYLSRNKWRKFIKYKYDFTPSAFPNGKLLKLSDSIFSYPSFTEEKKFNFLSLTHEFKNRIDWNYASFGKLWTYNLNYFEFLLQPEITKEQGLRLISNFIQQIHLSKDGVEPFPTSLRIIFWIKFLIRHQVKDSKIDQSLYAQTKLLSENLEYHLLGNHLLENGFALFFSAYYFHDESIYLKAKQILCSELEEQILSDGAHFELSPMYHQHMLFRLLDCINLIDNNSSLFDKDLYDYFLIKARNMLGWLKSVSFENGDIPLLNDSAFDIAPTSKDLFKYATRLGIEFKSTLLSQSGYRIFKEDKYKLILDIGKIGPDYIPGHAHSDTFNFVLYTNGQPFLVDTGTSTYEKNDRRRLERSTQSHNTVMYDDHEQSQIWGGFRVGKRATTKIVKEGKGSITAVHNGYQNKGILHYRTVTSKKQEILIADKLDSSHDANGKAFLHFHPSVVLDIEEKTIKTSKGNITIENANSIIQESFYYSPKFNLTIPSTKVIITFTNSLKMNFKL